MAAEVNNVSRKRKSTSDLIFEVSEADCSPTSSPEPKLPKEPCIDSLVEKCETITELNITTITEEKTTVVKTDVDLRCMDMEVANSPPPLDLNHKPFVTLTFRDKDIANKLKLQLIKYIKSLVDTDLNEDSDPESELKVNLWESNFVAVNNSTIESKSTELFVVDTTPSSRSCKVMPRYITNHCNIIEEFDSKKHEEQLNTKSARLRPMPTCFNCLGNHAMKDCTETKDHRRIHIARTKFMAQKNVVRYHDDDEQKYTHLQPGNISEKLRRALDIRKYEVPGYIYKMRILGYPPGWLQEALVQSSNLELFDSNGCVVDDRATEEKVIDPSKVIDYPGFNVPLEKGFKDEYKYFNCPPYSENFSKQNMLEYIQKVVMETKQLNKMNINNTNNSAPIAESDSNSRECENVEKIVREGSPSLIDLENKKKQLLAELEGSLDSPQPNNNIIIETEKTNVCATTLVTDANTLLVSPVVVSSKFGTPILKSASPYFQLPDRDKWSRDISQVINFENLPNATGKYEQMTKVIHKVRDVVKSNLPTKEETT